MDKVPLDACADAGAEPAREREPDRPAEELVDFERIARARSAGGRVIAVGTTVLRALESSLDNEGKIKPGYRYTSLFITPGYKVKSADLLFTNFHLPRSTLFILVCALGGVSRLKKAYKLAIEKNTDFFLMVTHV